MLGTVGIIATFEFCGKRTAETAQKFGVALPIGYSVERQKVQIVVESDFAVLTAYSEVIVYVSREQSAVVLFDGRARLLA